MSQPLHDTLNEICQRLQAQVRRDLMPSAEIRQARLQQVIDMVVAESESLVQAIEQDYVGRCHAFSTMTDIVGSLASLKYARDNLAQWIEPYPTEVMAPYDQMGAEAFIQPQAKGVVGIVGTWNCPLYTILAPAACALAAGNTIAIKPSDNTPHTAAAFAAAAREHLDPNVVAVITGDVAVSIAFAEQPWAHLVFTGSTQTGKKIMAAAAQNLVPVTLELGGKSPAILGTSADVVDAARRLAIGKGNNGGQICISPDTIYVPEADKETFISAFLSAYTEQYPQLRGNEDIVPILNDTQYNRLTTYLTEAIAESVEVHCSHNITPATVSQVIQAQRTERRLPLSLVVNPGPDLAITKEEIFGPLLVVRTYQALSEVSAELAQQEKPLALYFFGEDAQEREYILAQTTSGGMTINDTLTHAALSNAPFGGVGASGMGHYHGEYGFREFSHLRTVFVAPQYDFRPEYGLIPPYTEGFAQMMQAMVTRD